MSALQQRLPLPTSASSPIAPELDRAIAALDVSTTQRQILRMLAEKDQDEGWMATHLGLSARNLKKYLRALESAGYIAPAGFVAGWGLSVVWLGKLGLGGNRPAFLERL